MSVNDTTNLPDYKCPKCGVLWGPTVRNSTSPPKSNSHPHCEVLNAPIKGYTDTFPKPLKHLTPENLYDLHQQMCNEAHTLMLSKNKDYGNHSDPFKNFRRHGALGILVRMEDKMSRLESFVEKGFYNVESENFRDTALDLINYSVLLMGYLMDTGVIKNVN